MKVSVVIPSYNYARFVTRAVRSVCAQTYKDLEIIVVDDDSKDNTSATLQASGLSVRYIRHDKNRGANAARNTGIRAALGEYIAFLDADDYWLPEKIERQLPLLFSRPNVGLVYANYYLCVGQPGEEVLLGHPTNRVYKRGRVLRELFLRQFVGSPTPVIPRRVFHEIGFFDETLKGPDDYNMWLRIASRFELDFVADPLAVYQIHPSIMSTRDDDYEGEMLTFFERFAKEHEAELVDLRQRRLSDFAIDRAWRAALQGRRQRSLNLLARGIRCAPWRLRVYIQFLLSAFLPLGTRKRWCRASSAYHIGRYYLVHGEFSKAFKAILRAILSNPLIEPKAFPALLLALIRNHTLVLRTYATTIDKRCCARSTPPNESDFDVRLV